MSKLGAVFAAFLLVSSHLFSEARATETPNASDGIDSVIYSDLGKDEMLKRLSPYVALGEKISEVRKRHERDFGFCLIGGPGVEDCQLANGLQLVADPDGFVRIIRRSEKVVGDRVFPEMSISTNILEWKGYMRGYPE